MSEERFKIIKLEIIENKDLGTTLDNKRYTLNDVNKLVNKIAEQKIVKNNVIREYNDLLDMVEQIAKLRSTEHRQKALKILIILENFVMDQQVEKLFHKAKN